MKQKQKSPFILQYIPLVIDTDTNSEIYNKIIQTDPRLYNHDN